MPNEPASQLRAVLKDATDEALDAFLHGYTVGSAAELFVNLMIHPHQRTQFLIAIAKTYPDDWKAANEALTLNK